MIAILLHKTSVWYELHGWSPRYFAPDLKLEIGRRLQDRVMFGADYPLLGYERLLGDWKAEGYGEDVLDRCCGATRRRSWRRCACPNGERACAA